MQRERKVYLRRQWNEAAVHIELFDSADVHSAQLKAKNVKVALNTTLRDGLGNDNVSNLNLVSN